jgi:hypothetical protein
MQGECVGILEDLTPAHPKKCIIGKAGRIFICPAGGNPQVAKGVSE